jgi:hypothetical protein
MHFQPFVCLQVDAHQWNIFEGESNQPSVLGRRQSLIEETCYSNVLFKGEFKLDYTC